MEGKTAKNTGVYIDDIKTPIIMLDENMVQIGEFESLKKTLQYVFGGVKSKQNTITDMCKHKQNKFLTHPKTGKKVTFRYK